MTPPHGASNAFPCWLNPQEADPISFLFTPLRYPFSRCQQLFIYHASLQVTDRFCTSFCLSPQRVFPEERYRFSQPLPLVFIWRSHPDKSVSARSYFCNPLGDPGGASYTVVYIVLREMLC